MMGGGGRLIQQQGSVQSRSSTHQPNACSACHWQAHWVLEKNCLTERAAIRLLWQHSIGKRDSRC